MDQKERQLEEISEKVNNYKPTKNPPIFEVFITLISLVLAIMLFLFPEMLSDGVHGMSSLYGLLLLIMPQPCWAFTFFGAGILKGIGMLIDNKYLRISGLIVSVLAYTVFAITYSITFPTIGSVIFTGMAVFSLISIAEVKRTGIK
ncbi:hypothetical protein CIL05_06710 [Virgibacillus profundi]|uniref:Uncharacterized protein n=1 Tax=Virgibacillus profundi TaxID=2024555 RepID=A0A2A2IF29_9BACI|nr:hypothetical protein [Virgibacillus profundi]PAV30152.1 hypothetical protein CIL05_06710 [Virgibacillus profundi]PXY54324.1 hypothetical protein CIT14_06795 [Virgibacillus profundi]